MDKDFSELIEYLDKKFEETAKKDEVNKKFEETASKKDLKKLTTKLVSFEEFDKRVGGLEREFKDFKNEILTNQDAMLKKLDILLTEKKIREYQEEKEKQLWAIIIKSLKEHRILSDRQLKEIAQLEIF